MCLKIRVLYLIFGFLISANINAQDIWKTANGSTVSFFSKALLEDIFAESNKFSGAINTKTNAVAIHITINTLMFENKLQQEHFNEKYMESDKYPRATFKGNLDNTIDWTKKGVYDSQASGTLTIHGVNIERVIPVTITISDDGIAAFSQFMVKVEDHKVKVPKLVFSKVAEEVEVTIKANFIPHNEDKK